MSIAEFPPDDDKPHDMAAFEASFARDFAEADQDTSVANLMMTIEGHRSEALSVLADMFTVRDPQRTLDVELIRIKSELYNTVDEIIVTLIHETPDPHALAQTLTTLMHDDFTVWISECNRIGEGRFDTSVYGSKNDIHQTIQAEVNQHITVDEGDTEALRSCANNFYRGIVNQIIDQLQELMPDPETIPQRLRNLDTREFARDAMVVLGKGALQALTIAAGILIAERFKRKR